MGFLGFIESNIYLVVIIFAILYIGFDLYGSKKRGELQGEKMKRSFERFLNAVKGAKFKHYVLGFMMFVFVFLVARGVGVVQDEMQECDVWYNQEMLSSFQMRNYDVESIIKSYEESGWSDLEQGRSYNYYRRWFNEVGGRANFVNINCSFSLDMKRFKKNVLLDYNEVKNGETAR